MSRLSGAIFYWRWRVWQIWHGLVGNPGFVSIGGLLAGTACLIAGLLLLLHTILMADGWLQTIKMAFVSLVLIAWGGLALVMTMPTRNAPSRDDEDEDSIQWLTPRQIVEDHLRREREWEDFRRRVLDRDDSDDKKPE